MKAQLAKDLRAAKALIDTPDKWTKGVWARDADGADVSVDDVSAAVCFCSFGACKMAVGFDNCVDDMMLALGGAIPEGSAAVSTPSFNDHPDTTHADVMALFDRAIAAAEDAA